MKKLDNGFTLIELLVVIAIIGILSGVVLASLSAARVKGADGAVKADLAGVIKGQAELYYSTHSDSYGTFVKATCPPAYVAGSASLFSNDSNIARAINDAVNRGGNGSSCVATPATWAVSVGLKTSGQSWCVDSLGFTKQFAGTPSASITGNSCT